VGDDHWERWHGSYGKDSSPLTKRLAHVQAALRTLLPADLAAPVRVISVCAGDSRDLIGVLRDHPGAGLVSGRLVEISEGLVADGQAELDGLGLSGLEFVCGDASISDAYQGATPADLVLVCGVLGNISDDDAHQLVDALPQLCAPGGHVVWTRSRRDPDLTPAIRGWFGDAGFEGVAFTAPEGELHAVGVQQYSGDAVPLAEGERWFSFVQRAPTPAPSTVGKVKALGRGLVSRFR
jgi:hypothetical protein